MGEYLCDSHSSVGSAIEIQDDLRGGYLTTWREWNFPVMKRVVEASTRNNNLSALHACSCRLYCFVAAAE